jgi:hypothetical protein
VRLMCMQLFYILSTQCWESWTNTPLNVHAFVCTECVFMMHVFIEVCGSLYYSICVYVGSM